MDVFEQGEREANTERIVVPNCASAKTRYYSLMNRASQLNQRLEQKFPREGRKIKSLHHFARMRLDQLMDEFEQSLKEIEREVAS